MMVVVREATKADAGIVFDLIQAIAKHHNQEMFVVTDTSELERSGFSDNAEFGVLLAEVDGEIAGYCSYTWNYSIWLGTKYMNIDDVFVWTHFRGKQVGEKLMQKAKEVALANDMKRIRWEVETDNSGAIKFYQRLGANMDTKGVFKWDISE